MLNSFLFRIYELFSNFLYVVSIDYKQIDTKVGIHMVNVLNMYAFVVIRCKLDDYLMFKSLYLFCFLEKYKYKYASIFNNLNSLHYNYVIRSQ